MAMFIGQPKQTERQFQDQVIKYAELMGWRHYHTHDSRHSAKGFPDLVLVRRPRVVFVELKDERRRMTDDQRAWRDSLLDCTVEWYLWRPSDWKRLEAILR